MVFLACRCIRSGDAHDNNRPKGEMDVVLESWSLLKTNEQHRQIIISIYGGTSTTAGVGLTPPKLDVLDLFFAVVF
jgi:hypothetical protein